MFLCRISLDLNVADPDLWHEMALARETIALGYVPAQDHFAYTPTLFPVVHHEWGAGLIAWWLACRLGPSGILGAKYFLALLITYACILCARLRKAEPEVLACLMPVFILQIGWGFATIRAQLYSFLFCACLLLFLEHDKKGRKGWIPAWLAIYVLWLNLHAGFVVGVAFGIAHCCEQALRKQPYIHLIIIIFAMLGLVAVNPYGFDYYTYLWRALFMARPYIDEWSSSLWSLINLTNLSIACPFIVSLMIALYSVKVIGVRNASGIAILLAAASAAALHKRMLPFYAIVWISFTPGWVQLTPLGRSIVQLFQRRRALLLLLFFTTTVVFAGRFVSLHPFRLLVPGDFSEAGKVFYPVGPVEYLRQTNFKGNVMTFFNDGSYVSWKLYPNVLVSMDGRYEVAYSDRLVDESFRFYKGEKGWESVLSAYPTDLVLVRRVLPIRRLLSEVTDWQKVYTDRTFELYARPGLSLPVVDYSDRSFEGKFP
jgi:hypothetical protein